MLSFSRNFASVAPVSVYEVSISPSSIGTTAPPGAATSGYVECNAQNGIEPYVYLWEKVSGDNISISSTSSSIVTFSSFGSQGQVKSAIYRCTVTDDNGGGTSLDDTVIVTFSFESGA